MFAVPKYTQPKEQMKTVLIQVSPKQQAEALERHQVTEDVKKYRRLIKLAREIAKGNQ